MTIQEAIEKSIEGGFNYNQETPPRHDMLCVILLDPSFWQSLGKAMGWKGMVCPDGKKNCQESIWRKNWHRFIDHLAEGKDINSFFEKL